MSGTAPALNTGVAASNDYSATGSAQATITTPHGSGNQLWPYYPNPYDVTAGSGTIDI